MSVTVPLNFRIYSFLDGYPDNEARDGVNAKRFGPSARRAAFTRDVEVIGASIIEFRRAAAMSSRLILASSTEGQFVPVSQSCRSASVFLVKNRLHVGDSVLDLAIVEDDG